MKHLLLGAALFVAGPAFAQDAAAAPGHLPTTLFSPYAPALATLGIWALLLLVLAFISVRGTPRGRSASGLPMKDYGDPVYRRSRAHMNALENAAPFLAAIVAAILTGASPLLVNGLAVVFLLARIAMAVVHVGTENQPLRSVCFVIGMLCIAALAVTAILGALAL